MADGVGLAVVEGDDGDAVVQRVGHGRARLGRRDPVDDLRRDRPLAGVLDLQRPVGHVAADDAGDPAVGLQHQDAAGGRRAGPLHGDEHGVVGAGGLDPVDGEGQVDSGGGVGQDRGSLACTASAVRSPLMRPLASRIGKAVWGW